MYSTEESVLFETVAMVVKKFCEVVVRSGSSPRMSGSCSSIDGSVVDVRWSEIQNRP